MPQRTSKRIYNQAAVEAWFKKLSRDWEPLFSDLELERGRGLYRDGWISELELTPGDAIIHGKLEGEACYVLVEWKDGRPEIRGSDKERLTNRSLAAAGIYEIEELIADEVQVVPHVASAEEAAPEAEAEPERDIEARPTRPLLLDFKGGAKGLALSAFWKNGQGDVQAFRDQPEEAQPQTDGEREVLVRLTGLCRKAGFRYQPKNNGFRIDDPERITAFFQRDFPRWSELFKTRVDPVAQRLKLGPMRAKVRGQAEQGHNGSMQMRWDVRAGNTALDGREIRGLMRDGGQLRILPHVGMVRIEKEQAEALEDWLPWMHGEGQPPRYLMFSLFDQKALPIELSTELQGWRESFREAPPPLGLPDFLRPYQREGARWLGRLADLGCHGLLADEMGLGKTLQTLSLLYARPVSDLPTLIICPASVVPVWCAEMRRFFPEMAFRVVRAGSGFGEDAAPVVWVGSYAQIRRHRARLDGTEFGYVVLDEAQQIKNPDAKISQTCFALRARHRIALTGTPIENRPLDLWTLFRFLMPGLLGSRSRFEAAETGEGREALLKKVRRQTQPFILRRTKKAVAKELPPKITMDLACPLSTVQRGEYERLTREGLRSVGSDLGDAMRERSMSLFTLLTRLRQASCDPGLLPWSQADTQHSGKIQALLTRLEEAVHNGEKAVIFSQFTSFLDRIRAALQQRFPDLPLWELTGSSPDRARPVDGFQAHKGAGVILVSLRAGGVGITLHSADYVFLMDPWWNPAVEEQAIDRVHRIGQRRSVFIYRLVASGTVEDRINQLKSEKRTLFDRLVGGGSGMGDLAEAFADLESLIQLHDEAPSKPAVKPALSRAADSLS